MQYLYIFLKGDVYAWWWNGKTKFYKICNFWNTTKKNPRKQVGFLSFPFHATKVIIGAPN